MISLPVLMKIIGHNRSILKSWYKFAPGKQESLRADVQLKDLSAEEKNPFLSCQGSRALLLAPNKCPKTGFEKALEPRTGP